MKRLYAFPTALIMFLSHGSQAFAATDNLPSINPSIGIDIPTQADALSQIQPNQLPTFLITLLFIVGIIIAIVFLIYGGIKWILSGGDSKQVEGARNHIVAAIVGLIIVIGAFFILNFVFAIITGESFSLDNLCIPSLKNPSCNPQ